MEKVVQNGNQKQNKKENQKENQKQNSKEENTKQNAKQDAKQNAKQNSKQNAKQENTKGNGKEKEKAKKTEEVATKIPVGLSKYEKELREQEANFLKMFSANNSTALTPLTKTKKNVVSDYGEVEQDKKLNLGFVDVLQEMAESAQKRQIRPSAEQDVPKEKKVVFQPTPYQKFKGNKNENDSYGKTEIVPNELYDQLVKETKGTKRKLSDKADQSGSKTTNSVNQSEEGDEPQVVRRRISTQILKNTGLKKYRKKEDRNSRVKHRNKYQKALQKRRSQVAEVKPQSMVYPGELSGIKAHTVKSVRLS
eukprot:c19230_g1_i3.p1 GENE.c19230_g1_i3~~c19230_g1_i3.p1  ORF type:complete len:308 (-),score=135.91 c19230_g1_i3:46-969(-)